MGRGAGLLPGSPGHGEGRSPWAALTRSCGPAFGDRSLGLLVLEAEVELRWQPADLLAVASLGGKVSPLYSPPS